MVQTFFKRLTHSGLDISAITTTNKFTSHWSKRCNNLRKVPVPVNKLLNNTYQISWLGKFSASYNEHIINSYFQII